MQSYRKLVRPINSGVADLFDLLLVKQRSPCIIRKRVDRHLYNNNHRPLALLMSSPQPTQIEGDAILCTNVTTLTEIINLNCIPSVQVHDTAVTRPLRLALGSATRQGLFARLTSVFFYKLRNPHGTPTFQQN